MKSQAGERTKTGPEVASVRLRVSVSIAAGVCAGIAAGLLRFWQLSPLAAWDFAAVVYISWVARSILPMNGDETAALASTEDPERATADVILVTASVASLIAVGLVLAQAGKLQGVAQIALASLGVVSVVLSWAVVHVVYALHYARIYYDDTPGGVDFNSDDKGYKPNYLDFAYLAFTLGMTFQVSDTNLKTRPLRAAALRHALLSYLFGTVIVATTINLIAGLSK